MTPASMFSGAPAAAGVLFLVELIVKGTLLLSLAALLVFALRRASAAHRHLVWACALIGLVALPWMQLALPSWKVTTPLMGQIAPGFGLLVATLEPSTEIVTPADRNDAAVTQPQIEKTYQFNKRRYAKPYDTDKLEKTEAVAPGDLGDVAAPPPAAAPAAEK